MPDLSSQIACIGEDGRIYGAGFLVGEKYLLTCAHVVCAAQGLEPCPSDMPEARLSFSFPGLSVPADNALQARVVRWIPDSNLDIALLEVTTDLPKGLTSFQLIESEEISGHGYHTFGFPTGYSNGTNSYGIIRDRITNGLVQFEDHNPSGYPVKRGYSGAPLWDSEFGGVVGMVAAIDANESAKIGYFVPSSTIVALCPEIRLRQTVSAEHVVRFVNRKDELDSILSEGAAPYHLVSAPAGYGKSEFLKELLRRFKEKNWLAAYISISEYEDLEQVAEAFALQFGVDLNKSDKNPGKALAEAILERYDTKFRSEDLNDRLNGVVLLVDIEGRPVRPSDLVGQLSTDFIDEIEFDLRPSLTYWGRHNRFRAVVAGRYVEELLAPQIVQRFSTPVTGLTSFTYGVVLDTIKAYLPEESRKESLAAHLMHYTAGHPNCLAKTLRLYEERSDASKLDSMEDYFAKSEHEIWGSIVWPESDAIRQDIRNKVLRRIIDDLSIYRYCNAVVLNSIVDRFPDYMEVLRIRDGHDLGDQLSETSLFSYDDNYYFLRDDITRRLIVRRFYREVGSEVFTVRCRRAQGLCEQQLREGTTQNPEVWLVEYWYQFFQKQIAEIGVFEERLRADAEFFDKKVFDGLRLYFEPRGTDPRTYLNSLNKFLKKDWEFQHTINYYLRKQAYDTGPFLRLLDQIAEYGETL